MFLLDLHTLPGNLGHKQMRDALAIQKPTRKMLTNDPKLK